MYEVALVKYVIKSEHADRYFLSPLKTNIKYVHTLVEMLFLVSLCIFYTVGNSPMILQIDKAVNVNSKLSSH
jgi:hypothetical protein